MSLYEPGDGLFDTHVTWEEIEEDMQRELDTGALFGPNKTSKNIGDGKGFMSRILLIEPDWQHRDTVLPERFTVKIPTQLALLEFTKEFSEKNGVENAFAKDDFMVAFETRLKNLHNVEVNFYSHLQRLPAGKFPFPKIYCMRRFTESNPVKGYIIMQYVEDVKLISIYENVPMEAIKEVLRALAIMQAMSLRLGSAEKEKITKNFFTEFYAHFFTETEVKRAMKTLRASANGDLEEKVAKVERYVKDIVDLAWADQLADEMGMERVACHGDLWSPNLLWKQNESGDVHLAAVIDFQTVHMGCSAGDLVRLFSTCLSGRDRQRHWEELLEEFYGYLQEEIGTEKMPYTYEQLKESYKRFIPLGSFLVVPVIQPVYDVVCKNPNEDEKKQFLDVIMEKVESLMDDIIAYHERNLERRR